MSAEEEDGYPIEKVLDDKTVDGVRYFKVKWEGYPDSEATWEPEQNLEGSQELVDEYLAGKAAASDVSEQLAGKAAASDASEVEESAPAPPPKKRGRKPRPAPQPESDAPAELAPYTNTDDADIARVVGVREGADQLVLTVVLTDGEIRTIDTGVLRDETPAVWAAFLEELIGRE
jgi:hypothetical protein